MNLLVHIRADSCDRDGSSLCDIGPRAPGVSGPGFRFASSMSESAMSDRRYLHRKSVLTRGRGRSGSGSEPALAVAPEVATVPPARSSLIDAAIYRGGCRT